MEDITQEHMLSKGEKGPNPYCFDACFEHNKLVMTKVSFHSDKPLLDIQTKEKRDLARDGSL